MTPVFSNQHQQRLGKDSASPDMGTRRARTRRLKAMAWPTGTTNYKTLTAPPVHTVVQRKQVDVQLGLLKAEVGVGEPGEILRHGAVTT